MQGANPCPQFFVKFKPYCGRDSRLYARVVEQADTAVSKTVILWVQIPPFAPVMKDFRSFYKTVEGNEGNNCHYPTRLDTYGCGCQHDCDYCYAKSLLSFRDLWDPLNPSVATISDISKEIRKLPRGEIVRLGGMTDCFQPCERLYRNTYKTIRLLNKRNIGYLIVTKSPLIAEDEYLRVMDKDLAHIQVSLTFTDDQQYLDAGIEKAPLPSKRIEAIEKLQAEGFDVCIRLSPYIPEFIDVEVLNNIKCDKILVEFLRVNHWIRRWLGDKCDLEPYTNHSHGYDHMPLENKKKYLETLTGFSEISVCEDEKEAYEYWREHVNPNKEDCCNLRIRQFS